MRKRRSKARRRCRACGQPGAGCARPGEVDDDRTLPLGKGCLFRLRGGVVRDLQKSKLFFASLKGGGDICLEDPSLVW